MTNIPGTTRDVLTVNIEIGGIPVTITDTAGIRDTPSDEIEAIGIQRALDELRQADLILLMIDSSRPALDAIEALNHIKKVFDNPRNLIVVKSKQDLPADEQTAKLLSSEPLNQYPQLSTSTKTADGLEQLRSRLQEALGIIPTEGVFSARRRHLGELDECYQAIERACGMLELGDLVLTAREITLAQNHLGTITGKVTSDDILGRFLHILYRKVDSARPARLPSGMPDGRLGLLTCSPSGAAWSDRVHCPALKKARPLKRGPGLF